MGLPQEDTTMERQDTDITLVEIREALDAQDWDRAAGLIESLRP